MHPSFCFDNHSSNSASCLSNASNIYCNTTTTQSRIIIVDLHQLTLRTKIKDDDYAETSGSDRSRTKDSTPTWPRQRSVIRPHPPHPHHSLRGIRAVDHRRPPIVIVEWYEVGSALEIGSLCTSSTWIKAEKHAIVSRLLVGSRNHVIQQQQWWPNIDML